MTTERSSFGLNSLIPNNYKSKAEAFARCLQDKLKSLSGADDDTNDKDKETKRLKSGTESNNGETDKNENFQFDVSNYPNDSFFVQHPDQMPYKQNLRNASKTNGQAAMKLHKVPGFLHDKRGYSSDSESDEEYEVGPLNGPAVLNKRVQELQNSVEPESNTSHRRLLSHNSEDSNVESWFSCEDIETDENDDEMIDHFAAQIKGSPGIRNVKTRSKKKGRKMEQGVPPVVGPDDGFQEFDLECFSPVNCEEMDEVEQLVPVNHLYEDNAMPYGRESLSKEHQEQEFCGISSLGQFYMELDGCRSQQLVSSNDRSVSPDGFQKPLTPPPTPDFPRREVLLSQPDYVINVQSSDTSKDPFSSNPVEENWDLADQRASKDPDNKVTMESLNKMSDISADISEFFIERRDNEIHLDQKNTTMGDSPRAVLKDPKDLLADSLDSEEAETNIWVDNEEVHVDVATEAATGDQLLKNKRTDQLIQLAEFEIMVQQECADDLETVSQSAHSSTFTRVGGLVVEIPSISEKGNYSDQEPEELATIVEPVFDVAPTFDDKSVVCARESVKLIYIEEVNSTQEQSSAQEQICTEEKGYIEDQSTEEQICTEEKSYIKEESTEEQICTEEKNYIEELNTEEQICTEEKSYIKEESTEEQICTEEKSYIEELSTEEQICTEEKSNIEELSTEEQICTEEKSYFKEKSTEEKSYIEEQVIVDGPHRVCGSFTCPVVEVTSDPEEVSAVESESAPNSDSNRLSNEEEQEDINPRMKLRRCSSLKTWKTPPGTPGRKKIVRFADALGLDLADVRTFLEAEVPKIPNSAYDDLQCEPRIATEVFAPLPPTPTLIPMFQQPGDQIDFMEKVGKYNVSLESAILTDTSIFTITGCVRVRNISFSKSVHVRYSIDRWQTYSDLQATYVPNSCNGFSDKFSFVLYGHTLKIGEQLEFAVRLDSNGSQYWDNNCGLNYVFQCLPQSPIHSVFGAEPITQRDSETWSKFY